MRAGEEELELLESSAQPRCGVESITVVKQILAAVSCISCWIKEEV